MGILKAILRIPSRLNVTNAGMVPSNKKCVDSLEIRTHVIVSQ